MILKLFNAILIVFISISVYGMGNEYDFSGQREVWE